ncbi:zinc finger protein 706, gene 2 [Calycina marina]|uniref:Zinc finger protein 706, gene 2 n=1 Tax=Calycina marina TaxID=1763456 RepID=A0A9P7YYY7_9HELO|nr:zinc finger protein 706, gene 2 [Calycina marina]
MARGLQKIEAQQKKAAAAKKGGNSILKSDKGMKYTCSECRIGCDNKNNMKSHWEAKHPKQPVPSDDFASMIKEAK